MAHDQCFLGEAPFAVCCAAEVRPVCDWECSRSTLPHAKLRIQPSGSHALTGPLNGTTETDSSDDNFVWHFDFLQAANPM